MARRPSIPIACTLTAEDAAAQAGEWVALRDQLLESTVIVGGRRLRFPVALQEHVRDLARREAACCAFLTIEVDADDEFVEVAISSPDPAAAPVIDLLAGASSDL